MEWIVYPFSRGSSHPGIELGSHALQADSLSGEVWSPDLSLSRIIILNWIYAIVGEIKRTQQCFVSSLWKETLQMCVNKYKQSTKALEFWRLYKEILAINTVRQVCDKSIKRWEKIPYSMLAFLLYPLQTDPNGYLFMICLKYKEKSLNTASSFCSICISVSTIIPRMLGALLNEWMNVQDKYTKMLYHFHCWKKLLLCRLQGDTIWVGL